MREKKVTDYIDDFERSFKKANSNNQTTRDTENVSRPQEPNGQQFNIPMLAPQIPTYYAGQTTNHMQHHEQMREGDTMLTRLDFIYDYDFDQNGLFAYLRKQCPQGVNPAYPGRGQSVKMFASSVMSGFPESLINAAEKTDFRTMDQAFSFVGFELLTGRRLVPACYSIRNCVSNPELSMNHPEVLCTLLNWEFEASHDMVSWQVLDRRINWPSYQMQRGPPSLTVLKMAKKGSVSTFGISPENIRPEDRQRGFKYFRIVQIGANFGGGHVLGLSGLEVYGLSNDVNHWEKSGVIYRSQAW